MEGRETTGKILLTAIGLPQTAAAYIILNNLWRNNRNRMNRRDGARSSSGPSAPASPAGLNAKASGASRAP